MERKLINNYVHEISQRVKQLKETESDIYQLNVPAQYAARIQKKLKDEEGIDAHYNGTQFNQATLQIHLKTFSAKIMKSSF